MKRGLTSLVVSAGLLVFAGTSQAAVSEEMVKQLLERIETQDKRIAELEKAARPAPAAAATPVAAAKPSASTWAEKVSLQGDFRYRYENIDQELTADERNRQRIRGRAAITAKPQEGLEVGFGLATSESGDPVSSNQTIGSGGSRKDIFVDLAYFTWAPVEGLSLTGGKFKNSLYRPGKHALLWDGDWNPEGVGAAYTRGPVFVNAVATWLDSDSNADEALLWGGQLGASTRLGEVVKLTGGLGYFEANTAGKGTFFGSDTAFADNAFDPLTNLYLLDYEVLEAFAELGFTAGDLPINVFADFVQNGDADEFDTGWAAGLVVGAAKAKGTWEASYAYQELEADAVFGLLTDSDFGGGGTDNKGHVFRGTYAVGDKWNLAFSYFLNKIEQNTGTEQDYDRLQLDLNVKY
jgi:hypothetical protein